MCRAPEIIHTNRTRNNQSLSDSEVCGWVLNQWEEEVLWWWCCVVWLLIVWKGPQVLWGTWLDESVAERAFELPQLGRREGERHCPSWLAAFLSSSSLSLPPRRPVSSPPQSWLSNQPLTNYKLQCKPSLHSRPSTGFRIIILYWYWSISEHKGKFIPVVAWFITDI